MKIEYRLNRNDHRVIEDFLVSAPSNVDAIVVEAPHLKRQEAAIEAAKSAGVNVAVELHTERLAFEGFDVGHLDYVEHLPVQPGSLRLDSTRSEFVKKAVAVQELYATQITSPSFHADDPETLELNVGLSGETAKASNGHQPVRAVLSCSRKLLADLGPAAVGARYRNAGVKVIDLRISPLGSQEEGPAKLRSVLNLLETLRGSGLQVVLGYQGTLGPVALATEVADSFSVGVGQREQYNFRRLISSQRRNASRQENDDDQRRGTISGIRLPALDLTAPRSLGRALISDKGIRSRLGIEAETIDAPAADPRPAYLLSRERQISAIADLPSRRWRLVREVERISRAIELRRLVNDAHLPDDAKPLKTRTLVSIKGILEELIAE